MKLLKVKKLKSSWRDTLIKNFGDFVSQTTNMNSLLVVKINFSSSGTLINAESSKSKSLKALSTVWISTDKTS